MMMKWTQSLITCALAVLIMVAATPAAAGSYPSKPINVIVPWGAGGDSDLTTRVWADAMEKELGVPVVVINKAGGGGVIGTTHVVNSKPDGYTLINAGLSNVLVTPNFSDVPYDFNSFVPVVKFTAVPAGIIVKADSPYQTFDDFISAAKENKLTMGSWGAASSGTILAKIIADQAGFMPRFVHANTTANSMVSVIGGHIDSAISFPPAFGPMSSTAGPEPWFSMPKWMRTRGFPPLPITALKALSRDGRVCSLPKACPMRWLPGWSRPLKRSCRTQKFLKPIPIWVPSLTCAMAMTGSKIFWKPMRS